MSAAPHTTGNRISMVGRCFAALFGIALFALGYLDYAVSRAIAGYYFHDPGSMVPSLEVLLLAGMAIYFLFVGATGRWALVRWVRKSK